MGSFKNLAAEITAIILALEKAVEKSNEMSFNPFMKVTITTDSKYAHGCMTEWIFKWVQNGWLNAAGKDVANRELLERALELEAKIEEHGDVRYGWVPREQNTEADRAANQELDEAAQDRYAATSSFDAVVQYGYAVPVEAAQDRYAASSSSSSDEVIQYGYAVPLV
ncbi:MAG: hypothetical protein Q9226_001815 [Calogaya cf. arnoldii]